MKLLYYLSVILAFLVIECNAASFPVASSTATVDVSRVIGDWSSFAWYWISYDSHSVTFTVKNGSSYVDMTGNTCGFKIGRYSNTGLVTQLTETNATISLSNVTFSVTYTNDLTEGDTYAELFLWSGSPTNTRTLAQGKITVVKSLYP